MQSVLFSKDFFLRTPTIDDKKDFLQWLEQHPLYCYSLWPSPPTGNTVFEEFLSLCDREDNTGYVVCNKHTNQLQGLIYLYRMYHGNFQNAHLGYFFHEHDQAVMQIAVRLVTQHALMKMKVHRIEAYVLPTQTLLLHAFKAAHYRAEGVSTRFLKIAGRWRDHARLAITTEDWRMAHCL